MINIIINSTYKTKINQPVLEKTAIFALENQNVGNDKDISIVIDSDNKLKELNYQFFGIEETTDVLSFPANEIDPENGRNYIGDIIISYPRAKTQSEHSGHGLEEELQILVIHGILHLLGFDHANGQEKKKMWEIQNNILNGLGCSIKL